MVEIDIPAIRIPKLKSPFPLSASQIPPLLKIINKKKLKNVACKN